MPTVAIRTCTNKDQKAWDAYVLAHPHSTLYHLFAWKNVVEKTYGHKTYYLMATNNSKAKAQSSKGNCITTNQLSAMNSEANADSIVGILPLVHMKHPFFGNNLISVPFFDLGGILADDEEAEIALLSEAIKLGQDLKANTIELRHIEPLACADSFSPCQLTRNPQHATCNRALQARSHKVRMLLELPESSDILMKSFKSKLRSQIKKPLKEGLSSRVGGLELVDDFYEVFSINMRDLGSPVHSKRLIVNVLTAFPEKSKIVIVYKDHQPLAASLIIGFKDIMENPWASALREYSRFSPNMLLYWSMLEYASDNGFTCFDFGRSSRDEGTYRFKQQWGSKPAPLHWHYISLNGKPIDEETSEKSKFEKAIQYWKKIPVPITKILGPMIRKHIGL